MSTRRRSMRGARALRRCITSGCARWHWRAPRSRAACPACCRAGPTSTASAPLPAVMPRRRLPVGVLRPFRVLVQALEHEIADAPVVDQFDAGVGDRRDAEQLVEVAATPVFAAPRRLHLLDLIREAVGPFVLQRRPRAFASRKTGFQRLRDPGARRRLACPQRIAGEEHAGTPRRPRGETHWQSPGAHTPVLLELLDRRQLPLWRQRLQKLAEELGRVDGLPVLVAVDVAEANVEPAGAHWETPSVPGQLIALKR